MVSNLPPGGNLITERERAAEHFGVLPHQVTPEMLKKVPPKEVRPELGTAFGYARLCGRDTMNTIANIESMHITAELAHLCREDPRYVESLDLKDAADKVDAALVTIYKTCSLKDFPEMRFRIGELKKDVIKTDWSTVQTRLDDIKMKLRAAFEIPD